MNVQDQNLKTKKRPKVAVVAGSGGIKAISSIPLFEFLEEAEIEVDLLIGCSAGSIFAAWWAVCNSADYMRENADKLWAKKLFTKTDYRTLLSIARLPFGRFNKNSGLLKPDLVQNVFLKIYGNQMMEDLPIRTMLQATDMQTGDAVVLSTGLVRENVYASGALYPFLPPIKLNGKWLIDGGFSSPLPLLEAVNEGADIIIAISTGVETDEEAKGFISSFMQNISYMIKRLERNQTSLSVDLHHYEIIHINIIFDEHFKLSSAHRIPEILDAGKKAVDEQKDEILRAIEGFSALDLDYAE
jgi:NTE family protein